MNSWILNQTSVCITMCLIRALKMQVWFSVNASTKLSKHLSQSVRTVGKDWLGVPPPLKKLLTSSLLMNDTILEIQTLNLFILPFQKTGQSLFQCPHFSCTFHGLVKRAIITPLTILFRLIAIDLRSKFVKGGMHPQNSY